MRAGLQSLAHHRTARIAQMSAHTFLPQNTNWAIKIPVTPYFKMAEIYLIYVKTIAEIWHCVQINLSLIQHNRNHRPDLTEEIASNPGKTKTGSLL